MAKDKVIHDCLTVVEGKRANTKVERKDGKYYFSLFDKDEKNVKPIFKSKVSSRYNAIRLANSCDKFLELLSNEYFAINFKNEEE